jgi:hypothetical protein
MTLTPLPSEVWAHTPPEAQAYIQVPEARVIALEATVRRVQSTVQHLQEWPPP